MVNVRSASHTNLTQADRLVFSGAGIGHSPGPTTLFEAIDSSLSTPNRIPSPDAERQVASYAPGIAYEEINLARNPIFAPICSADGMITFPQLLIVYHTLAVRRSSWPPIVKGVLRELSRPSPR